MTSDIFPLFTLVLCIKEKARRHSNMRGYNLHSTLVLLKDDLLEGTGWIASNLHSTLVLLKGKMRHWEWSKINLHS